MLAPGASCRFAIMSPNALNVFAKWGSTLVTPSKIGSQRRVWSALSARSPGYTLIVIVAIQLQIIVIKSIITISPPSLLKCCILLYIYRIMRHTRSKSGRQAIIQAAKDGHNPRPENTSGRALPLFYNQNIPTGTSPCTSSPSSRNRAPNELAPHPQRLGTNEPCGCQPKQWRGDGGMHCPL